MAAILALALSAGLVAIMSAAVFVLVRLAGGSPHPLNHLGYAPILLAAYLYGWRGGLARRCCPPRAARAKAWGWRSSALGRRCW